MARFSVREATAESVDVADVRRIMACTQVVFVRMDEVHAGPLILDGKSPVYGVRRGPPKFGYVEAEEQLLVRIEHEVKIAADESLEESSNLTVAHVIAFAVTDEINVTLDALSAWIESNVYFMVYPYVRETLASLTTRMGLPPLTLNYLPRDARPFEAE